MSMHEAQAQFHYWCAARHCKVETRRFWQLPLRDARTTITSDQHPNQIRLLRRRRIYTSAPAVDLPYRQGDLKCRGRVGEVSCAFL